MLTVRYDWLGVQPGDRVLDLGCGTGTLAIAATARAPRLEMVGLDGDPVMLERARAKAAAAGARVDFDEGLADALPYAESSFDAVLSSLFFHHVTREVKERTAGEVARVLRLGGSLHVLDWGPPRDPLTRARFLGVQLFDGFATTRDTVTGALPDILAGAGLVDVRERGRLHAAFGVLSFWSARRG